MPEIKRSFSGSKMNKDMDERLVDPKEYRDALNIEVNTSEGSNVGTVQTILGNTALTSIFPSGSVCVGSIADSKTDKIYWLVAGAAKSVTSESFTLTTKKDYIVEYDVQTTDFKYVLVDIYEVKTTMTNDGHGSSTGIFNITEPDHLHIIDAANSAVNITGVRRGMNVTGTFTNDSGATIIAPNGNSVTTGSTFGVSLDDDVTVLDIQKDTGTPSDWRIYTSETLYHETNDSVTFSSERLLNFDSSRLITGLNILDGMLFWTDNYSEPKKINIERCIVGTGGTEYLQGGGIAGYTSANITTTQNIFEQIDPIYNTTTNRTDHFHTRLVSSEDGVNLQVMTNPDKNQAVWLEEQHITVLKKAPLTPPYLDMSSTEVKRTDNLGNLNNLFSSLLNFSFAEIDGTILKAGDSFSTTSSITANAADTLTFEIPVDFKVGDEIILTNNPDANPSTFTVAEVRISISAHSFSTPTNGPYSWSILAINPTIGSSAQNWTARLLKGKSLFEFKLPRFAYRYKYKDGEYSTISPWSEIAFLPGNYDYMPKQGYNLGMVNQIRSLKITDYIVEDYTRGHDVIEVDILFKNEDSPNIYTVKTVRPTDKDPNGKIWPDQSISGQVYDRGEYEIESELIHAILPSDQLIRPWDNVPIKAKAQDITANRLIYGNYVQNYDVIDTLGGEQITPNIQVTLQSTLGDLATLPTGNFEPIPSKSVKSLRTYQIGVVYRDKYGRETPVLPGDAIESTITIDKKEASSFNKIKTKIESPAPYWADSWKFFIKETSNEYYSLAMDRWYNAEDGNVWISFPSAERNKIQDDTFLILKKQHTTDFYVKEEARYKVISVKNEAPEFIKRNTKVIGKLINTASNNSISTSAAGFPFIDANSMLADGVNFKEEFLTVSAADAAGNPTVIDVSIREAMHSGFLHVRFGVGLLVSGYYKIANMVESSGGNMQLTIDGIFGEDIRFLSPLQTTGDIQASVYMELATKIPENKAEFDGRFFVKILNDLAVKNNILKFNSGGQDYRVVGALNSFYINYSRVLQGNLASGSLIEDIDGNGFNGQAEFNFFTTAGTDDDAMLNYWDTGNPFGLDRYREATRSWWRSFGAGWFIDSAITANEETKNSSAITGGNLGQFGTTSNFGSTGGSDQPTVTDIEHGTHGIFNSNNPNFLAPNGVLVSTDTDDNGDALPTGDGTVMSLSFSGIFALEAMQSITVPYNDGLNHDGQGYTTTLPDYKVGVTSHLEQANVMGLLNTQGAKFRFSDDVDKNIYTIRKAYSYLGRVNFDCHDIKQFPFGGKNDASGFEQAANKRLNLKLVVTDDNGNGIGCAGGSAGTSYNPLITDSNFSSANSGVGTAIDSDTPVRIEFIEPFSEDDYQEPSNNPAVWETEPKEDVGLDIYYEASQAYPVDLNARTNEQFAKIGSIAENESLTFGISLTVRSWSNQTVTLSAQIPTAVTAGDIISFTTSDGGATRLVVKTDVAANTSQAIDFENTLHEQEVTLPYSNCFSFQNGVESNRIRDDYNENYIKNGVKASAVLAKHYEQERRGAGLIHSGIYNSTSGINELNQFIQGNPITKDLNPRHGSIQKLLNRNTDLAVITEDKCFKVMANKDMLFNADGNSQVVASNKVLGQTTPYTGDFGTTNPESFAQDNFRAYFVDRTRGKVCRLSMDGVTAISSAGMHDWFADNLKVTTGATQKTTIDSVLGSFDTVKQMYNVTIKQKNEAVKGSYESPIDTNYTLSYSETAKGWVSFKSFYPESGVSLNNEYYTFKDAELWKHHVNETRNNFYGVQYDSSVTTILNDNPGSVKSFNTINYEGSQAKITQHKLTSNTTDANGDNVSQADGQYYNLNTKKGWYVDSFETNEQSATIPEFKEKEGKWFNYIRGIATTHVNDTESLAVTSSNLDQKEFSVQGIGVPSAVSQSGMVNNVFKFKVTNNTSTSYNPDTERDGNTDGAADGIWDSSAD